MPQLTTLTTKFVPAENLSLRILLIAPHPFFQERGTPIAVDLLLTALSERGETVDVLTLHEGENRNYANIAIHRIKPWLPAKNVPPGFSPKKLICDVFVFARMIQMLWQARKNKYDVVHAIEESAFMAWLAKPFFKTPFIYDMDALLSAQLIDKFAFLNKAKGLLNWLEEKPVRGASMVVPMCQAIADIALEARQGDAEDVVVLKDVSLVNETSAGQVSDLKNELGINVPIAMYIGNLEVYQGIQLMLEAVKAAIDKDAEFALVVIGGKANDIQHYQSQAQQLGIADKVFFLGPRPVSDIAAYMVQASVLLSPRTQGINTPMKVYSYLDSGVPVLATRLFTHTQVMTDEIAKLVEPNANDMADGLIDLLADKAAAQKMSERARAYIEKEHSYEAFKKTVDRIYDRIAKR